jgi:hypothetical protein
MFEGGRVDIVVDLFIILLWEQISKSCMSLSFGFFVVVGLFFFVLLLQGVHYALHLGLLAIYVCQ